MITNFAFGLTCIGLIFSLIRLFKGPSIFDKVLSLDTINVTIIGVIVLLALIFNNDLYIDIAIVYAILSFIETIIFARVLEGEKWYI